MAVLAASVLVVASRIVLVIGSVADGTTWIDVSIGLTVLAVAALVVAVSRSRRGRRLR